MTNENLKIPLFSSGVFLFTSPITQWVFGLGGGYIAYSVSQFTGTETNEIVTELMAGMALVGLVWFILAKSQIHKWLSSFIVLFSICNTVLFFSMGNLKEYFYPDRYIIGSLISGLLLIGIELVKRNQQRTKPKAN